MTVHRPNIQTKPIRRIDSIDVLRGLTIMLMMFVNDIAGISAAPSWLKHVSADADAMTIADLVFPAFLFVVGLSLPIAIERRLESGQQWQNIAMHTVVRAVSLMIIGVLYLNRPDDTLMGWPAGLWRFLVFSAVFVAWHNITSENSAVQRASLAVRVAAIAALIFLAVSFRDSDGHWLRTEWWGILGMIGWSYLICSALYAVIRDRIIGLFAAMWLLICIYIAFKEGSFRNYWVWTLTVGGTLPSVTMAGIIVGTIVRDTSRSSVDKCKSALLFAGFMFVCGWLMRPLYGVNKIAATPSWCLWSAAITCTAWAGLYWLIDIRGWTRALKPCRLVGRNALFAYILAAAVYTFFGAAGLPYYSFGADSFAIGLMRAVFYTALISGLSGLAAKWKFTLKL